MKSHPEMVGTDAAECPRCYGATYGVAIECAYENMQDAGEDVSDDAKAETWARSYVENGDVSAYYCTQHDPVNADYFAARDGIDRAAEANYRAHSSSVTGIYEVEA